MLLINGRVKLSFADKTRNYFTNVIFTVFCSQFVHDNVNGNSTVITPCESSKYILVKRIFSASSRCSQGCSPTCLHHGCTGKPLHSWSPSTGRFTPLFMHLPLVYNLQKVVRNFVRSRKRPNRIRQHHFSSIVIFQLAHDFEIDMLLAASLTNLAYSCAFRIIIEPLFDFHHATSAIFHAIHYMCRVVIKRSHSSHKFNVVEITTVR
mmetsp:Transcript_18798/g.24216  ORF Transcript_18798/g.24216 Transcript_18798/m.24216 type:complete len:207 (-) Transcript_18798:291-911(-)